MFQHGHGLHKLKGMRCTGGRGRGPHNLLCSMRHDCVSYACPHYIQNNISAPSSASVLHCHNLSSQHCLVTLAQLFVMFMPVCLGQEIYMQIRMCICLMLSVDGHSVNHCTEQFLFTTILHPLQEICLLPHVFLFPRFQQLYYSFKRRQTNCRLQAYHVGNPQL